MINLDTSIVTNKAFNENKFANLKVDTADEQKLKKVCDDFESFFSQQLMDISLQSTDIAGKGAGSDIIKGMYTEAVSQNTQGTIGISDMLYKFLSENNK